MCHNHLEIAVSHYEMLSCRWIPKNTINKKLTSVQVMTLMQATTHYLSQCWPRSMSPYGITMLHWVNSLWLSEKFEKWIIQITATYSDANKLKITMVCHGRNHTVSWHNSCYVSLTHWSRDEMVAISQTTLSSAFSWKKMSGLRLKFHWSLFLWVQLTIFQHCFR